MCALCYVVFAREKEDWCVCARVYACMYVYVCVGCYQFMEVTLYARGVIDGELTCSYVCVCVRVCVYVCVRVYMWMCVCEELVFYVLAWCFLVLYCVCVRETERYE